MNSPSWIGHDVPSIKGVYWNMNVELTTISIKYRFPVIEKCFSLLKYQRQFNKQNKSKIHIIPNLYRLIYNFKILSAFQDAYDSSFHISFCMMLLSTLIHHLSASSSLIHTSASQLHLCSIVTPNIHLVNLHFHCTFSPV